MTERLFYKVTEVAEMLAVSKSKAYELVASGVIPSTRIGGLLRVSAEALRKLEQPCEEDDRARAAR